MKNKILFLAAFISLAFSIQQSFSASSKTVKYNINGKLSTYHCLNSNSLTHLKLKGPGILTMTFRARFTEDSPEKLSFGILYLIDSTKVKTLLVKDVVRLKSTSFIQSSSEIPSTSRTFTIKINPDVKDVAFSMQSPNPQVDFRYKFVADSVTEWRDIKPIGDTVKTYLKVDISDKLPYYRFNATQPQKFKIKGPATVRVITRLEYDYTMQGIMSYRVKINRNNTFDKTYKLTSKPSTEAQYVQKNKFIPGVLKKFYIDVPAGTHIYEISLLDKRFSSLIRVSKQYKK